MDDAFGVRELEASANGSGDVDRSIQGEAMLLGFLDQTFDE